MATTYTNRVNASANDAAYTPTGSSFISNAGPIAIGKGSSAEDRHIYLRFLVNVPQGKVIENAYITFRCYLGTADQADLNIYVQPSVTTSSLITTYAGAVGASKSGPVAWSPGAWSTGLDYSTPNIASLLQPLVSNASWSAHSMNFFIENTGTTNDRLKYVTSYENSTTLAPLLTVEYSDGFAHLDVSGGQLIVASAVSGNYLVRHSSGGYLRKTGIETSGALILDNGIIKEKP